MARQIGPRKFTGTVHGLSFYYNRLHGYLVRQTGGITSKQYHKDNRYAASRDASSEFSNVSRAGKLIREALGAFALQVKDGTMVNRLNKELVFLKQRDQTHFRGERRPEVMMADTKANLYFRIFQFNEQVKLYDLTEQFPQVERRQNALQVRDVGLKETAFPEGATHAGLTLVRTVIDFEKSSYQTRSSQMSVVSREELNGSKLVIEDLPSCAGTELVCVQVVFFREVKGDLVQVKGRVHSMGIIAVNYVPTIHLPADVGIFEMHKPVKGLRAVFGVTSLNGAFSPSSPSIPLQRGKRNRRFRGKRDYKLVLRGKDFHIYADARGRYFLFRQEGRLRRRVSLTEWQGSEAGLCGENKKRQAVVCPLLGDRDT